MGPLERLLWIVPDDAWVRFENHRFWNWFENRALTLMVGWLVFVWLVFGLGLFWLL